MGVYLKALRFYKAQSQISFVCGLKGCTTNGHNLLRAIVKLYSGIFFVVMYLLLSQPMRPFMHPSMFFASYCQITSKTSISQVL